MLFMLIERFKRGAMPVGERFRHEGRMLPDEVVYHSSWVEHNGERCFQLMEAPSVGPLQAWTCTWEDLCEFEIVPVVTSREFWPSK